MKSKSLPLITATLAAVFVTKALALEAPTDDAPPPPPVQGLKQSLPRFNLPKPATKPAASPTEKAAFLGVVSGEIPLALADHLNLKNGEGVLIRSVAPDSPAARAGIAINDVITKFSGQYVGSPQQFSAQISSHQPGESIKIDLIHKGQPTTLDVILGTKPIELANADRQALDSSNLDGFPKELADRVRDAIAGNVGGLILDEEAAQLPPQVGLAMRNLQMHLQGKVDNTELVAPSGVNFQSHSAATIKMMDEQGSIEVETKGGTKKVTLCDPEGNVTWSGPWDTAQDKASVPTEIRNRVDALHLNPDSKGNGLHLRMNQVSPAMEDDDN